MTEKQFRRMKIFALRMVPVAIGGGRWIKELKEHTKEVLLRLDDEAYGCHWSYTENWDKKTRLPDDDGTCGFAWRDHRMLLCDFISVYLFDNNLQREKEDRHGNVDIVESKMGIALSCCIRAACDVAVVPSGGVLGFTVGDLKDMWRGRKLPWWITEFFDSDILSAPDETGVWL